MEEKDAVVVFSKEQVFELVQIIFDNDKDEAFRFLEEHVYAVLQKRKDGKCKSRV